MINIRITNIKFQVSGFDAAMGRWVAVSGADALGFPAGDGILARMAQASTRLRLQLRGLAREPERLLVELEVLAASCAPSSSEFTVAVSIPRLTWSVLNSGFALPPSPGGALEEPFGDFSFFGVHLGVWQGAGQGLAVGARAESVGVDFYNMSTLSLVPLVVPEDNHMHVCVRMVDDPRPRAVALRTSLERCGKMCVAEEQAPASSDSVSSRLPPQLNRLPADKLVKVHEALGTLKEAGLTDVKDDPQGR
eukprot:s355_g11.t1